MKGTATRGNWLPKGLTGAFQMVPSPKTNCCWCMICNKCLHEINHLGKEKPVSNRKRWVINTNRLVGNICDLPCPAHFFLNSQISGFSCCPLLFTSRASPSDQWPYTHGCCGASLPRRRSHGVIPGQ